MNDMSDYSSVNTEPLMMKEEDQFRMEFLNKKLYYYISAVRRLQNSNKLLQEENEKLKKKILRGGRRKPNILTEEIQKLRNRISHLEGIHASTTIEKGELLSIRDKLKINVMDLIEDKERLQHSLKRYQEEVSEMNKALSMREAKAKELQEEIDYLERHYQVESMRSYKRYKALHQSKLNLEIEVAEYQRLLNEENALGEIFHKPSHIYNEIDQPNNNTKLKKNTATVRPWGPFNPSADAESLYKVMKGFGTDEGEIVEILSKRSRNQRNIIAEIYYDKYNNSLIDEFKSELSGDFLKVCKYLLWEEKEVKVRALRDAMAGFGTDEALLFEILCTQNAEEIDTIKKKYEKIFERKLERDVASETSGGTETLLMEILKGNRSLNNGHVSRKEAKSDAELLFPISIKDWIRPNSATLEIITKRSFQHLNYLVTSFWKKYSSKDLIDAIDQTTSGDIKTGLLTLFRFVLFPSKKFYAVQSHEAMQGLGTNDQQVIYIITTRCEIDLLSIEEEYLKLFNKSMKKRVEAETSGYYKKMMVALLG